MSDDIGAAPAPAPEAASPAPPAAEAATQAPETPSAPAAEDREAALDAQLEAIFDKARPERSGDGKFAARKPAGAETTGQPQPGTSEQATPQTAQPAIAAPQAWPAEYKAKWESVPPDLREFVARRETEAHQVISRQGQELSQVRPLRELIASRRETFARHNADFNQGIQMLLDVQDRLDRDPAGTVAAIAEMYGVDLSAAAGLRQAQQTADPMVLRLQSQVQQLENQLAQRQRAEQEEAHRQNQALQQQTQQEVTKWAEGKEHFPAVRTLMGHLMAQGQANSLDDAYDMACNALPDVRAKFSAAKAKAEEEKRRAEQEAQVTAAKKASALNVGGSRRAASSPAGRWDDDSRLAALFDQVAGG